jgi:hypothetical protein
MKWEPVKNEVPVYIFPSETRWDIDLAIERRIWAVSHGVSEATELPGENQ